MSGETCLRSRAVNYFIMISIMKVQGLQKKNQPSTEPEQHSQHDSSQAVK